jgi:hypothetical protein
VPDTGAPWNIPYAAPADLVKDWPALSEDVAEAVADGLDAAGGLVAVKHALFTGTQTNSTAAGANFAVTDLSITHTLADAANKLILMAYFGAAANSENRGNTGLAIAEDGTLLGIGDAVGLRTSVGSGGEIEGAGSTIVVAMPNVHLVHSPGDTSPHTYTANAINIDGTTRTVYINRSAADQNSPARPRSASGLMLMEVKV